jgi:hypothetical protein
VDGRPWSARLRPAENYIGIAAAEAFRAEALLSSAADLTVPVVPMVVLVTPGTRTIRAEAHDGVRVVADGELLAELQLARREFSDEQVERIVAAAHPRWSWNFSKVHATSPLPPVPSTASADRSGHSRDNSRAFCAWNSSSERIPLSRSSASRSICAIGSAGGGSVAAAGSRGTPVNSANAAARTSA